MKIITILHLLAKCFFVSTIFIFVKDSNDIGLAIFLHSSGFFVSGLLSIVVAVKLFDISFHMPSFQEIVNQLQDGWNIFISQLMVAFYTTINIIVLGIFHPGIAVASYALSDKVYRLIGSFSSPFNRAIFPMLSIQYSNDIYNYQVMARRSIIALFIIFSLIGTIIFFLSPWIILILAGSSVQRDESEAILKILSIAIPFFVIAASSTYHLVTQERAGLLLRLLVFAAVVNTTLIFPISFFYKAMGVAWLTLAMAVAIAVAQTYAMLQVPKES